MPPVIKRNAETLADAPVSEWLPNLKGKDLPEVVVESLRRLHSDLQSLQQKVDAQKPTVVADVPPQPVLNTFTELNIGSPATAGGGSVRFRVGLGSPETIVTGSAMRDVWLRLDGGAGNFLYLKQTGADSKTGWIVKF